MCSSVVFDAVPSVPGELHASNTPDIHLGVHSTNSVGHLGVAKVDMQVVIGHPRNLAHFAKALAPSFGSFKPASVPGRDPTNDEPPLLLGTRTQRCK